jgi:Transposase DDE domain group 1
LMIAAGYEDGNDANGLRVDPIFKMALDLSPSDRELCSQATISRIENVPDARALLRMGRAMVLHPAFWLVAGGCGASASTQNQKQSRGRAGVHSVPVKALHNGG